MSPQSQPIPQHIRPTQPTPQNTPSSPIPLEPLHLRIKPNQTLRPNIIPQPKQLRNIHIQRTIRLRTRQQLMYRRHRRCDCVCGTPRRLEQIEAYLARLEVDVGVADGRDEAD